MGKFRDSVKKDKKITKLISFNCFISLEVTFTQESNVIEENRVFMLFFDTTGKKVTCLTSFSHTSNLIVI